MYNHKTSIYQELDDIDDNHNSFFSPKIEVKIWTPKKKLKRKKIDYSKIKENQGSPSEKKNMKRQDKA